MLIPGNRMWRFACIQVLVLCVLCDAFPNYATNARPAMRVPSNINDIGHANLKKAHRDVSDTIAEVQKFLERDPTLPRLTRGEIEELFEKVTREEYERSLNEGNMNRAVHMKSLMLVLPYNANNNSSDSMIEEFYTRPPITKIVDTETKVANPQQIVIQQTSNNNNLMKYPVPYKNAGIGGLVTTYKPNLNVPITQKITTFRPMPTMNIMPSPIYHSLQEELNNGLLDDTDPVMPETTVGAWSTANTIPSTVTKTDAKKIPPKYSASKEQQKPSQPFVQPSNNAAPKLTPEIQELLKSIGLLTNEKLPEHIVQEEFQPIQYPHRHNLNPTTVATPTVPIAISNRRLNVDGGADIKAIDFEVFKPLPRTDSTQQAIDNELAELLKSYGILDDAAKQRDVVQSARGMKSFDDNNARISHQNDEPMHTRATEYEKAPASYTVEDDLVQGLTQVTNQFRRDAPLSSSSESANQQNGPTTKNNAEGNSKTIDRMLLLTDDLEPIDDIANGPHAAKLTFKRQSDESVDDADGDADDAATTTQITATETTTTTTETSAPFKVNLDLLGSTSSPNNRNDDDNGEEKSSTQTPLADSDLNKGEQRAMSVASTTTEASDRFGALDLDPVTEEPLPPPRRNGFYFFTDWNSFLEVGEEPDQVVVRFDPKVGDPSRFIPVKIP